LGTVALRLTALPLREANYLTDVRLA